MSREGYEKAMVRARDSAETTEKVHPSSSQYINWATRTKMWALLALAEALEPEDDAESIKEKVREVKRKTQAGLIDRIQLFQMDLSADTVEDRPSFEKFEADGVVGVRCVACRHFQDNHAATGCRECGCPTQGLADQ